MTKTTHRSGTLRRFGRRTGVRRKFGSSYSYSILELFFPTKKYGNKDLDYVPVKSVQAGRDGSAQR